MAAAFEEHGPRERRIGYARRALRQGCSKTATPLLKRVSFGAPKIPDPKDTGEYWQEFRQFGDGGLRDDPQKGCGQPWGRLAARDPVWDGEGWGCDRVA